MKNDIKNNTANEEVKQEDMKEEKETIVSETKKETSAVTTSKFVDITPFSDDEPTFVDVIEEKRRALHEDFNKTKMISRIMSIVVIAGMIGALILVVQQNSLCKTFGYVIAGVLLVGMIIYYVVTRKKFPNASKDYIKTITTAMNRETFSNKAYSEVKFDCNEKFQLTDTLPDHIYKDVIDIGSRNVIHGKFNKAPFTCGELALYVNGQKRGQKVVCFLGYYGSRENSLHFEDRYILVARGKGETPSDLPTDIDDLKVLFEEGNFLIYGKEGANFKKDLGSKFLSAVKGLSVDGPFINFNAVVMAGRTSFYMSYDDTLMALPFEKPFDPSSRNHFTKDLLSVFEITELI